MSASLSINEVRLAAQRFGWISGHRENGFAAGPFVSSGTASHRAVPAARSLGSERGVSRDWQG